MTLGGLIRGLAAAAPAALLAAAQAGAQALPSDFTTGYRYDAAGRQTGTIAPDPDGAGPLRFAAVRNSYDSGGRLVRVETGELADWQGEAVAPIHWTGFTVFRTLDTVHDAMDRKVRVAASGGGTTASVTEYSYDGEGRLACTAIRMNPASWALPVVDACTHRSAHPVHGPDRITRNVYDPAGQLRQVREAVGTAIEIAEATRTYNGNGLPGQLIDANGNRAELRYDGHMRLSRWVFPSKTRPAAFNPATADSAEASAGALNEGDYEDYGYDPGGNRTSLRKRDGALLAYHYDALNRVTAKLVPASASGAAGYSVHYGYDLRGLQTYARFGSASGPGITNAWDGFGRLASSATSMDGVSRSMAGQYDAHGNRILLTGDQGYYAPFGYDGLDRMSAYANLALFGYDAAGRRSSLAMGPGWTSSTAGYGYDPAGRLQTLTHALGGTSADQTLSFTYNSASQIVTRSGTNAAFASNSAYAVVRPYGVNGLNQYTTAGPETFTYDASGNLASDGSTSFVYDAENRLVAASGAKTASLAYDPLGRLWQVTGPSGTTRFLYDGDRLVMEYNSAGAATRSYVHGPGTDEPLVWYDGASGWARRYFHADHQGSIIALNDDAGTPIAINAYDAWGIPNAGNAGRFGYTGQAWIAELGLWYYKARFYSPTMGRFMQVDPIGYEGGINLYAYVGNDPLNRTDPLGLYDCASGSSDADCGKIDTFVQGITEARDSYETDSQEYKRLDAIIRTVGTAGDGNGITIANGSTKTGAPAEVTGKAITLNFKLIDPQVATSMMMDRVSPANAARYERINGAGIVAHEVDHIMNPRSGDTRAASMASEFHAFSTQEMVNRNFGIRAYEHRPEYGAFGYGEVWARQMAGASTNRWCRMKVPPC